MQSSNSIHIRFTFAVHSSEKKTERCDELSTFLCCGIISLAMEWARKSAYAIQK